MASADAVPISGHVARGFERVHAAFRANCTERGELGGALAVLLRGVTVVDVWGGTPTSRHGASARYRGPTATRRPTAWPPCTGALADGSDRLVVRRTIDRARTGQVRCVDAVAGVPNEFGLGCTLGSTQRSFGPNPTASGHDACGGTTGFADPEAGIGFAYVMNQLGPGPRDDPRKTALVEATYSCLAADDGKAHDDRHRGL